VKRRADSCRAQGSFMCVHGGFPHKGMKNSPIAILGRLSSWATWSATQPPPSFQASQSHGLSRDEVRACGFAEHNISTAQRQARIPASKDAPDQPFDFQPRLRPMPDSHSTRVAQAIEPLKQCFVTIARGAARRVVAILGQRCGRPRSKGHAPRQAVLGGPIASMF